MASTSMPSMPSVPLISASPSFSASVTGAMPAAAQRLGRRAQHAVGVADHALAHQRQRAVGERSQITGAAEAAVLVHHRGDPGVEQVDVGLQRSAADAGAAGGQRRDPQQHQGPDHLPLDLRPGAGGVRTDQAALQLGRAARPGCAGWPARRSRWRRRSAVRVVGERLDHRAGAAYFGQRLVGDLDRCAVPGHGDHVGERRAGRGRRRRAVLIVCMIH